MTLLKFTQFVQEIKDVNTSNNSPHKIRIMKRLGRIYFKLHLPSTSEIIETVIKETDLPIALEQLGVKTISSFWIPERINRLE